MVACSLASAFRLAFGLTTLVAGVGMAWLSHALISAGNVQTEGSPAGAIIGVLAYLLPLVALLALLIGTRLIWRGLR